MISTPPWKIAPARFRQQRAGAITVHIHGLNYALVNHDAYGFCQPDVRLHRLNGETFFDDYHQPYKSK